MFPIGDDNPTRRTSYVTYGLIAIYILVFFYQIKLQNQAVVTGSGEVLGTAMDYFLRDWAVVPRQLTATIVGAPIPHLRGVLSEPPEFLTLVTSQFLHGGLTHLIGNMLFLWIFGNNVEDKLGRVKFLIFYLMVGVLSGLTQWMFSAQSMIPSLGASGAIAGVMGAYILRFPKVSVNTFIPPFFILPIPAFAYLGIWFIQQALSSIAQPMGGQGGVAYWAHSGGFVFGAVLGVMFGVLKRDELEPEV
ncbi:MAG: rhomboid family intramembrane serine protease [Alkalinema sp. CAN_BIN05]|nr:rhomboid family intramembrane serine protease [Alkalinema sp. CAN_BIN05]